MCVSYQSLNAIVNPFQYPIQQCDDFITFFAVGSNEMWIFNLYTLQGYHQVAVRTFDQDKLALLHLTTTNIVGK